MELNFQTILLTVLYVMLAKLYMLLLVTLSTSRLVSLSMLRCPLMILVIVSIDQDDTDSSVHFLYDTLCLIRNILINVNYMSGSKITADIFFVGTL